MSLDRTTIDIDKRQAALREIDDASFGWHHVRACLVAGTGFFMDAYDIFAIGYVSSMIAYVYYPSEKNDGKLPPNIDLGLKVSVAIGTLFGQLIFGHLADRYGRKRMYGIELIIIIVSAISSAFSGEGYAVTTAGTIMFWRVIMGIGIGGDYPLSAIITSEFATKKRRGAMMASVFAMQGFGILAAAIVSLIVLAAFKSSILEDILAIDYCWRLVLGLGVVPGLFALYFRLTIPETPRYTMDVDHDINKATIDITSYLQRDSLNGDENAPGNHVDIPKASLSDFISYFGKWKNGKILLGTSMSWFAVDVAFYGIGLNNSAILNAIGYAASNDPNHNIQAFETLKNAAIGNVIIAAMGTVPGYWFTVLFIDKWGRKPIQLMGFTVLTVLFVILGAAYNQIRDHAIPVFIVLFTLVQFFQNFGPNSTTFIIPGEVFPTRYRSTGHGISAASGKLGAIVAQVWFSKLADIGGPGKFVGPLLLVFAVWMFIGLLFSILVPETKGLSLEELANEEYYRDDERYRDEEPYRDEEEDRSLIVI